MSQLKPTNRAEQGERPIFEMNGTKIDWKTPVKDVGLVIDETLGWSENVNYRVRKAMKSFFMLKRNASSLLLQDRSVDLYRSIINITLLFGSESWELWKSEFHLIKNFNRKVLKWINGNVDYKEAMKTSNLLPPLYFKVLKDFLMFSNIANESYDVDFNEFLKIKDTGRRKTVELPIIKYETQRLNFW